jgi:hypothetical protein
MDVTTPDGELAIRRVGRGVVRVCSRGDDPELLDRLAEIASEVSRVGHPGLAPLVHLDLSGGNLEMIYSVATDAVPLADVEDAVSFLEAAAMIAQGLAAAYALPSVCNHTEIDPQLLLARPGGGQVVGAGVWQLALGRSESTLRCPAGLRRHTSVCPEWLIAGEESSPRTATFFLANALWIILCRARPFPVEESFASLQAVRDGDVRPFHPRLSFALPEGLGEVLGSALSCHPRERASPELFAEQLKGLWRPGP